MPVAQGGLTFLFGNGAASATWQLLFYLTGNFAPGSGHQALQVAGAAPPSATGGARWVVGTLAPTKYARLVYSNHTPSTADFGATPEPSSGPVVTTSPTLGDCYRSGRYRGDVRANNWFFAQPVQASPGNGGTQDGRIRLRIWKGSDPTGSNATELTSGATAGTLVTNLSDSTYQVSSATVSLPAFTLNSEFLFFQVAWEITGAGGSATADVATVNNWDAVIFGPPLPTEIPGFYAYFQPTISPYEMPIGATSVDLTPRLMAYHSRRGREDALSGITAGQLSADFDDDDSVLDPENTASSLYPDLKLRKGLSVVASYGGITYYRGRVSIDTYNAQPLVLGADVSIAGQDVYKQLNQQTISGSFPEQSDGLRVQTILESLPYLNTVSADGTARVAAVVLVDEPVLQHFDHIVKATRGTFFIGWDGNPVYRDRHWRLSQVSIGTFGAQGTYPIPTPSPVLDEAGLYNHIVVNLPSVVTADDATSQADYGVIPYTLDDDAAALLLSAEDGGQWAGWFLYQHKDPKSRFQYIDLDPYANPALWPLILAADIGTKLVIMHDLPGTKGMMAEPYYVEGFDETGVLAGEPDLKIRWSVSRAETDTFWILDEYTELEVDTRLAY
jgi:hypothetical protein